MRVLTYDEQERLQNVTLKAEELPAYGIIFALNTGIRLGELIALQWKDVNFLNHSIKIRRTAGRLKKVDENGKVAKKGDSGNTTEIVVRTTKTISSQRVIPIFPKLWNDFMEYRNKQNIIKEAMGSEYNDDDYVFSTIDGRLYDPHVFEDLFK